MLKCGFLFGVDGFVRFSVLLLCSSVVAVCSVYGVRLWVRSPMRALGTALIFKEEAKIVVSDEDVEKLQGHGDRWGWVHRKLSDGRIVEQEL